MAVYCLTAMGQPVVKIGHSSLPPTFRLQHCFSLSPVQIYLAAIDQAGDELTEAELLNRLAPHRVHGEWFNAVPEVVAVLTGMAKTGTTPGGWYIPRGYEMPYYKSTSPTSPLVSDIERAFGLSRSEMRQIIGFSHAAKSNDMPMKHAVLVVRYLIKQGVIRTHEEFFRLKVGTLRAVA